MLPVSLTQSSADGDAICLVPPVLVDDVIISLIVERMGQNQRQRCVWSSSPGGATGANLPSTIAGLFCNVKQFQQNVTSSFK